jgi:hypothetical protein
MRHVLNERILKLNLILGEQIHISDFTMELLKVQIKFKKKQQSLDHIIKKGCQQKQNRHYIYTIC